MTSSNLVGPGSNPGGPVVAGRSGPVNKGDPRVSSTARKRVRFPRPVTNHDRDELPAAGRRVPVIDYESTVAGSSPARSVLAPVAQLAEQFRAYTQDRSRQQSAGRRGSRNPSACGPEWGGYQVERPTKTLGGREFDTRPAPRRR